MTARPRAALAAALLGIAMAADAAPPPPWTGPYQDVALARAAGGSGFAMPRRGAVLIWAFATGECGAERWGDEDAAAAARAGVAALERAGRDFVVATGGAAAAFTCASDAAMARFVARYRSPRLVGLDFDIERDQTETQIDALVRRAAFVRRHWPRLRLTFTLATHAASDGSRRSLNATGQAVLRALATHGPADAVINLMAMNYGPPDPRWCVPVGTGAAARCDMGRSALQAVHNVRDTYGLAPARLALTLMLGENDVPANATDLADARTVAAGARALGLAGVHYWSADRDRPCPATEPARVSPRCHGLPDVPAGVFGAVLDARGHRGGDAPAAPKRGD